MKAATLPKITEKQFMAQVIQYARLHGWLVYHTHDSRRSTAGYPDLTLLHPKQGRLVVAELKVGRNRCTAEQQAWLAGFTAAGVPAFVWTPESWADIEATLSGA